MRVVSFKYFSPFFRCPLFCFPSPTPPPRLSASLLASIPTYRPTRPSFSYCPIHFWSSLSITGNYTIHPTIHLPHSCSFPRFCSLSLNSPVQNPSLHSKIYLSPSPSSCPSRSSHSYSFQSNYNAFSSTHHLCAHITSSPLPPSFPPSTHSNLRPSPIAQCPRRYRLCQTPPIKHAIDNPPRQHHNRNHIKSSIHPHQSLAAMTLGRHSIH